MAFFKQNKLLREEICDAIYTVIPEGCRYRRGIFKLYYKHLLLNLYNHSKQSFQKNYRRKPSFKKRTDTDSHKNASLTIILFFLPLYVSSVPRLVQLFHKWSNLDQRLRTILDKEAETWGCSERIDLYLALTDAFSKWEHIQATEGAPGCDTRLFDFNPNEHIQQQLLFMVEDLESMVDIYSEESTVQQVDNPQNNSTPNHKHRAPYVNKTNANNNDAKTTQSLRDFSEHHYE